jgi:hypothetical protein
VQMQVVKLTEVLPIDPRTRKPKHGAIDVLIKEQKHAHVTGLRRDIVNKARTLCKKQPTSASNQTCTEPSSASDDAPAPGDTA